MRIRGLWETGGEVAPRWLPKSGSPFDDSTPLEGDFQWSCHGRPIWLDEVCHMPC